MALSADRTTRFRNPGREVWYEVKASTTIYQGSLVCIDNTTGKAEPATNASGKTFVGVAQENAAAASSGTTYIKVWSEGEFLFLKTTSAVTDVGNVVSVSDDATVANALGTLTTALTGTNNDLVWTAKDPYYGLLSDAISITYKDPLGASKAIAIDVFGSGIVVWLATNASSVITSTGDTIKTALGNHVLANSMVSAVDAASNDGSGVVTALASTRLAIGPIVGTAVGYDSTTQLWIDIARKTPAGL